MKPPSAMKTLPVWLVSIILLLAVRLEAQDLALTLMAPTATVPAGRAVQIDLLAVNPADATATFVAPRELPGRLSVGERTWSVTVTLADAEGGAVPAHGYAARSYRVTLPADATGPAVLEINGVGPGPLRAALVVAAPASNRAVASNETEAEAEPTMLSALAASEPAYSALQRTFAGRFTANDMVYFIYGSGLDQAAKFQFSFDYRLATIRWGEEARPNAVKVKLGYTQRSLWDIDSDSSPFYDSSYMPEVAFDWEAPVSSTRGRLVSLLRVRSGYQHESNGRDGDDSRSLNIGYVRPSILVGSLDSWHVLVEPTLFGYIGGLSNNPDLADYRGYGKLRVALGKRGRPVIFFTGQAGKDFDHFTYQIDFTTPITTRLLDIETFFVAQYFNGYGESLLSYTEKSDALRFGLSLIR